MKKVLMTIVLINILAIAGLVAFLAATGRVDKEKAGAIIDLLKHRGTPQNFRQDLSAMLEPLPTTTSAPATGPAGSALALGEIRNSTISASDSIQAANQIVELERLKLESDAQELRHRQELLDTMQRDVQAKLKKIEDEKKDFERRIAAAQSQNKDDGIQRSLALYDELKPKQIKELFIGMPAAEVAKYLQAMEAARAAKIIGEFKTPEERVFISQVLELIRSSGTSAASPPAVTSATTPVTGS